MILVTGCSGYLGSICSRILLEKGLKVIGVDNRITDNLNKLISSNFTFHQIDLTETKQLDVLLKYQIDTIIHFAGLKSVPESKKRPIDYYYNNFVATLNLVSNIPFERIIFSSSASIYMDHTTNIDEEFEIKPISVYAQTKYDVENMLINISKNLDFDVVVLRYFNPIGTYKGLKDGELATNLLPVILRRVKKDKIVYIFGDDYPTDDGTGVRDYIHVLDLIDAHLATIKLTGINIFNVGTGKGTSVKEMIDMVSKVLGKKIKTKIAGRRDGDKGYVVADCSKIYKLLGWKSKYSLEEAVKSAVNSF